CVFFGIFLIKSKVILAIFYVQSILRKINLVFGINKNAFFLVVDIDILTFSSCCTVAFNRKLPLCFRGILRRWFFWSICTPLIFFFVFFYFFFFLLYFFFFFFFSVLTYSSLFNFR